MQQCVGTKNLLGGELCRSTVLTQWRVYWGDPDPLDVLLSVELSAVDSRSYSPEWASPTLKATAPKPGTIAGAARSDRTTVIAVAAAEATVAMAAAAGGGGGGGWGGGGGGALGGP